MKNKVLFFIFIILIGCQTNNNINNEQSKSKISDKNEAQDKPEIDVAKIPPKKNENKNIQIDLDVDEKKEDSKIRTEKEKTRQTSNKDEKYNNDLVEINNMKIKEYALKEIEIEVDKELYISLKNQGWIIKSMNPNLIKLLKRDNFQENTLFQFKTYVTGTVNVVFIRNDEENKIIWRQPYKINILQKSIDKKEKVTDIKSNNMLKEKKSLSEEQKHIKELADKYFNEKNYKEAKILYLQLLNEGISDSEIYYKLGVIENINSSESQALNYFRLALEGKDNVFSINALIELLKILKNQKKYKDAIDIFYKYGLNENIDKLSLEELYMLLADIYYVMKNYNNSSKEYNGFIKKFPNSKYSAKALFYLASSLENLPVNPDFKEAYRLYKIIVNEYPDTEYYILSKNRILYLDRHYLKVH